MFLAGTQVAARIERCECRLLMDAVEAALRRCSQDQPVAAPLAGGVATYVAPGSPLNKLAGLGFAGAVEPGELDAIEQAMFARGSPVHVELSCLAEPSIAPLLTRRGYALRGFENVLACPLPAEVAGRRAGDEILIDSSRRLVADGEKSAPAAADEGDDELATWLQVAVRGFARPDGQGVASHEHFADDVIASAIRDMAVSAGFTRYLARVGRVPAGCASMRVHEGVAQLCGATTLPEFRRRGVHAALLAHRLRDAVCAGCDLAVITTQPGSKSQENVQRRGFQLLYTRAILVLDVPKST